MLMISPGKTSPLFGFLFTLWPFSILAVSLPSSATQTIHFCTFLVVLCSVSCNAQYSKLSMPARSAVNKVHMLNIVAIS